MLFSRALAGELQFLTGIHGRYRASPPKFLASPVIRLRSNHQAISRIPDAAWLCGTVICFSAWMWCNIEVLASAHWLRACSAGLPETGASYSTAERHRRARFINPPESWNLCDRHMVRTLLAMMTRYGHDAMAVIRAHNLHIGNAAATATGWRGGASLALRLIGYIFGTIARAVLAQEAARARL